MANRSSGFNDLWRTHAFIPRLDWSWPHLLGAGLVRDDALWLDARCLEEPDEAAFVAQLAALPRLLAESGGAP